MNVIDTDSPEMLAVSAVKNILTAVGISENKDAMDYFRLMEEAVVRELLLRNGPAGNKYKEHRGREVFIAIFKSRYKIAYDIEYDIPLSPKEAGNVSQMVKKLEELDIPVDFYLQWYFDDFLASKGQKVESISFPCSTRTLQSFRLHNQERIEEIRNMKTKEKSRISLFERAKVVIRTLRDQGKTEDAASCVSVLKEFNAGSMDLEWLKEKVSEMERKSQ